MSLVQLLDVRKIYNGTAEPVQALRGITLAIHERAFVALMGRSGSGKSTLLSILGAMSPPSGGRVTVDGIDIYSLDVERRADFRREYLGFVFQQLYLMPYLTAIGNVMLPLAATGIANPRQRELASEALERVGLADKATRLPRDLSGGEQQRVAIARALVNGPPLVLADEPTGCLDTETGRGIMELFLRLRDEGLTIFMVTHDRAIAAYADEIVTMQDGLITPAVAAAEAATAVVPATSVAVVGSQVPIPTTEPRGHRAYRHPADDRAGALDAVVFRGTHWRWPGEAEGLLELPPQI